VIDTGTQKVVYRETTRGLFEGVQIVTGPRMTDGQGVNFFPVLEGLTAGEQVVTAGSFLIDAETRLNPAAGSIYFGATQGAGRPGQAEAPARPSTPADPEAEIDAALGRLSADDRALAAAQRYCAVLPESRLGSMGVPVKLVIDTRTVFVCCDGCRRRALADPRATLDAVERLKARHERPIEGESP
jgi:hypothetical protein